MGMASNIEHIHIFLHCRHIWPTGAMVSNLYNRSLPVFAYKREHYLIFFFSVFLRTANCSNHTTDVIYSAVERPPNLPIVPDLSPIPSF